MKKLPHISTGMDGAGRAWIRVCDTELFNHVEDFLIEEHDLEYMWVRPSDEPGEPTSYTMTFPGELVTKIEAALSLLDPIELHEIYIINNPEGY